MSKTRILLVEDSEHWLRFIRHTLCEDSLIEVVCEVADGFKAVRMAEKIQPDIVLLDIGLPGLNGIEACGWICRVAPLTRVVFLTEHRDSQIVQAAMNRGAWGYVLKSDCTQDLIPAIRSDRKSTRLNSSHPS